MKRHVGILALALVAMLAVGCGGSKPEPAPQQQADEPAAVQPVDSGIAPEPATPAAAASEPEPSARSEPEPAAAALPKLWDFFATWCGPCKTQAPIIAELEHEYEGKIEIKSIDVDQNRDLAEQYGVEAIPTLVFLDASGKEVGRKVGLMQKDELVAKFRSLGFIQ